MSAADALVLAWHGSRNPAARRLIDRIVAQVADRLPGVDVQAAWVDIEPVRLADTLAEVGACVLVPCFLAGGYHATHDVPEAVAATDGQVVVTTHLNGSLDDALLDRVLEAGGPGDAIVLAAAGSKHPGATAEVAATAERLSRRLSVPVTVGNIYQSAPSVSEAVAAAIRHSKRQEPGAPEPDILVLPYALAPGLWGQRIASLGTRVAAPLGAHEGVCAAIVSRYRQALPIARGALLAHRSAA